MKVSKNMVRRYFGSKFQDTGTIGKRLKKLGGNNSRSLLKFMIIAKRPLFAENKAV